jgi:hypothetical protein
MAHINCPHCGSYHPSSAGFCPVTGQKIPDSVSCPDCGTLLEREWKVCASCGNPLTPPKQFPDSVDEKQSKPLTERRRLLWLASLALIAIVTTIGFGLLSGWGDNHSVIAQIIRLREKDNEGVEVTLDSHTTEATSVILTDDINLATANTVIPEITGDQITSATPSPVRTLAVVETSTSPVEITEQPQVQEIPSGIVQQMDRIQKQVSELRGLSPIEPVTRRLLTREELRKRLVDNLTEDYSMEEAIDDVIVLSMFGLLDPGFDLYHFYLELYTEQISGFYDTETKEMHVVLKNGFTGVQKLTYAHEFVHALQDQHFDIREGLGYSNEACDEDSERCAAVQALLEGDASLMELQWFSVYATQQDFSDMQEYFQDYASPVFDNAPAFIQADLLFPYLAGQAFVDYFYQNGGWGAVDLIYKDPPVSTEQILHPERYPQVKSVPVEIPDITSTMGSGWREVDSDTLGEWYTYLVLAHGIEPHTRLDESQARDAADGWAGDTYAVYTNDRTNQTIMVLVTAWKNETEAVEFSNAFHQYVELRFGLPTYTQTGTIIWDMSAGYIQFRSKNEKTTWIQAPDRNLGELIWSVLP